MATASFPHPLQQPAGASGRDLRFLFLGGALALGAHVALQWGGAPALVAARVQALHLVARRRAPPQGPYGAYAGRGII